MRAIRFFLLAFFVFAFSPAFAQGGGQAVYDMFVAQLKGGNTSTDYQALRYAFAETPAYNPYGLGPTSEMMRASNGGDLDQALKLAEQILASNYVDIDAHMVSFSVYSRRGDMEKAEFHRAVARGLISSISASGDGKTPETAFPVISVREEYIYLLVNDFKVTMQALLQSKNGPVDAMSAVNNKTGRNETVYFDINRLFAGLAKQFPDQKK